MIVDASAPQAIARAVGALRGGALVGMPTETVYGLAGDACNDEAVTAIFRTKGRPASHPLIVHIAQLEDMPYFAAEVPDFALALAREFWPGPLTLILPRRAGVADAASGHQPTIGLRCPSHPVAQALLRACAAVDGADAAAQPMRGLAAPSANRFGGVSPTTAQHVRDEFGEDLLILDGGPCVVGIESSVVDCTRGRAVLLRPGGITRGQLGRVCRIADADQAAGAAAPKAPGTLLAHYAPKAKVRLMDAGTIQTALDLLGADAKAIGIYARSAVKAPVASMLRQMPAHAAEAQQQLFATLREFDDMHARLIWVETPPDGPEWEALRDRLRRAAAASEPGATSS